MKRLFFVMMLYSQICSGQIDSLFNAYEHTQEDSSKIETLKNIALFYNNKNPDSTIFFAKQAIKLSQKADLQKKQADSYRILATGYISQGKYAMASEALHEGLMIYENLGDQMGLADIYMSFGFIYDFQKQYDKGLKYYQDALHIFDTKGSLKKKGNAINNIGTIYYAKKEFKKALDYYFRYLSIAEKQDTKRPLSIAYHNIGDTYSELGEMDKGLGFLFKGVEIDSVLDDQEGLSIDYHVIAKAFQKQNKIEQSLEYAQKCFLLAKKLDLREQIKESSQILYENYKKLKNVDKALEFYEIFEAYKDSLFNEESIRKIENLQADYNLDKKEQQIALLEKDKLLHNEEVNQQKLFLTVFVIGLLFVLLFLFLLFRSNQEIQMVNTRLKEQKTELEQLNQIKDKLFSIISHDFRSPLNTLLGTLHLLDENALSITELKFLIKGLTEKVNYTSNFLDNLLYWAKSQMEGMHILPEKIDLKLITEENIRLFQYEMEEKGILVDNQIIDQSYVLADLNMIRLVVRNLLMNAIKFSSRDNLIKIIVQKEKENMRFSISDNGVGINDTGLANLFQPDTHFSTTGTDNEKGTGLGLLLCKDFIERNNGRIWAESKEGEGSTFSFSLPISSD